MDSRSLIATNAALLLAACAAAPPAPPVAATPISTPARVAVAAPVAVTPAQPGEMPVFVDEVDSPMSTDGVVCKEEALIGTRISSVVCRLAESDSDHSPGATHQVYIQSH